MSVIGKYPESWSSFFGVGQVPRNDVLVQWDFRPASVREQDFTGLGPPYVLSHAGHYVLLDTDFTALLDRRSKGGEGEPRIPLGD